MICPTQHANLIQQNKIPNSKEMENANLLPEGRSLQMRDLESYA